MQNIQFINAIEILWSIITFLICVIMISYAYCVGKMLILTAKISQSQKFHSKDESVAKRLLFINSCITIFLLIQFGLSAYFSLFDNKFSLFHHILNVTLNLLFIILLCWMYRKPMRRLIKADAKDKYHQFHRCCSKLFILGSIDTHNNKSKSKNTQKNNSVNENKNDIDIPCTRMTSVPTESDALPPNCPRLVSLGTSTEEYNERCTGKRQSMATINNDRTEDIMRRRATTGIIFEEHENKEDEEDMPELELSHIDSTGIVLPNLASITSESYYEPNHNQK